MTTKSFLQSPAWQRFQAELGRQCFTAAGDGWSYMATLETGVGNRRLYTPAGPAADSPASFDAALTDLKQLANSQGASFIRVEPQAGVTADDLRSRGCKLVNYQQLQPSQTRIINLSPGEDQLLAQMSQNSRNLTRNYQKKGLVIRRSNDPADIQILIALLAPVFKRNQATPHSASYFETQASSLLPTKDASLFIAEYDNQPIAASLVYDSADTRTYAHAAASDQFRKLSAGTALVGEMILDAKRSGLKWFDLYGVAPVDQPNHAWAGFSRFKASFGGDIVTFPGTWDYPVKKLRYFSYRTYQTLRHRLRQK